MSGQAQDNKAPSTEWRAISYTHNGKREQLAVELPSNANSEDVAEAKSFVETLEANEQIQHEPGPMQPGKTHQIETDAQGNKRLVRKRYSAI